MPTFKARVVCEVSFVIEVEADDAFNAMDAATCTARKLTPEQFAQHVTKGVVRGSFVDETKIKKIKC